MGFAGKDYGDEEIAELRARVQALKDSGLTWRQLSAEAGIPTGTLSGWVSPSYSGNAANVAAEVDKWLTARVERAEQMAQIVPPPSFQATPTGVKLINALSYCQAAGEFGLVSSPPGCGKSEAFRQYAATRPRVFLATMEPTTSGLMTMLIAVLEAMNQPDATGTPQRLARQVAARLTEPGGMLIVDEAQHLSDKAIEQLRALYDRTNCGLIIAGNEIVYGRISPAGKRANYAQISSRVGVRVAISGPKPGDVLTLIRAWGVPDRGREADFLREIAQRPGALRNITKTMRTANFLASDEGVAVTIGHLRDAWAQASAAQALERAA